MMFLGAKYCSHCGARADRTEADTKTVRNCPRCRINTRAIVIGQADLRECARCEGIWADAETLQRVCTNREEQAAVLGVAAVIPKSASMPLEKISYLPCPVCRSLMQRVNFARCSAVIVDVCRSHGTWFDKDELRRVVEFIQAGGIEKARAHEIAELERQRRQLESARTARTMDYAINDLPRRHSLFESAFEAAAGAVVDSLFR